MFCEPLSIRMGLAAVPQLPPVVSVLALNVATSELLREVVDPGAVEGDQFALVDQFANEELPPVQVALAAFARSGVERAATAAAITAIKRASHGRRLETNVAAGRKVFLAAMEHSLPSLKWSMAIPPAAWRSRRSGTERV